ncbi:hypothetical protein CKAN_00970400 [Cinnamomum micranthum f. kanehirae]|uniref:Uncharacterized protein n=1 Tax=Cinnamomum micranthum f. kanehirae TaxID=337451 RepID=A0A443NR96_9MAGN|nr:hypothetical protein CKAN_00970400 [Cinnamomum micranthum f. kanehirae]
MVLWEITLATAYFLGLKRTYRLALRMQRRLVSPNHPKIRNFLHRRTRYIFDVALKVHQNIQQRDIEVGRNLGNRILRYLDRMKPSAHIRGGPPGKLPTGNNVNKQMLKPGEVPGTARPNSKVVDRESNGRHLFSLPMNVRPNYFPTLGIMMRPSKPASMIGHRHFYSTAVIPDSNYRIGRFEGVFRKDIMQWMQQN